MHHQGAPEVMQDDPRYDDVLIEVYMWLEERIAAAVEAGIARDKILIDPGFGFGKNVGAQPRADERPRAVPLARLPAGASAPAASAASARCPAKRRPTSASAAASLSR